MNLVDVITIKVQWDDQAQSLGAKLRVLIRFPSPLRNGYDEAHFTGEDITEIAYQITQYILELATS